MTLDNEVSSSNEAYCCFVMSAVCRAFIVPLTETFLRWLLFQDHSDR